MKYNILSILTVLSIVNNKSAQSCLCSPSSYTFTVKYSGTCEDSIGFDAPAIDGVLCYYSQGGNPEGGDLNFPGDEAPSHKRRQLVSPELRQIYDFNVHGISFREQYEHARRSLKVADAITTITSVSFSEVDITTQLNIINQDSTYFNTTIDDGQILEFTSVSAQLNASEPLDEQLQFVPSGVMLVMFGINSDNIVVQNTMIWGYNTNYCSSEPLEDGAAIGWAVLSGGTPPSPAFCPAIQTTTSTEATTTRTTTTETSTTLGSSTTAVSDGNVSSTDTTTSTEATTEETIIEAASVEATTTEAPTTTASGGGSKSAKSIGTESSKATTKITIGIFDKSGKSKGSKGSSTSSKIGDAKAGKKEGHSSE